MNPKKNNLYFIDTPLPQEQQHDDQIPNEIEQCSKTNELDFKRQDIQKQQIIHQISKIQSKFPQKKCNYYDIFLDPAPITLIQQALNRYLGDQKQKRNNLYKKKERNKTDIQSNDLDSDKRYMKTKQGLPKETKNLPKYLKTIIKQLGLQRLVSNNLNDEEKKLITTFIQQSYSFSSMHNLFGYKYFIDQIIQCKDSDRLRRFYLQQFSSASFIKRFCIGKMSFSEKKHLIKYSQIARSIPINPIEITSWK